MRQTRAEVERLKGEREKYIADVTYACGRAVEVEADLARVRAALGAMTFDTSDPPDEMDCPDCRENERLIQAALEGRG